MTPESEVQDGIDQMDAAAIAKALEGMKIPCLGDDVAAGTRIGADVTLGEPQALGPVNFYPLVVEPPPEKAMPLMGATDDAPGSAPFEFTMPPGPCAIHFDVPAGFGVGADIEGEIEGIGEDGTPYLRDFEGSGLVVRNCGGQLQFTYDSSEFDGATVTLRVKTG